MQMRSLTRRMARPKLYILTVRLDVENTQIRNDKLIANQAKYANSYAQYCGENKISFISRESRNKVVILAISPLLPKISLNGLLRNLNLLILTLILRRLMLTNADCSDTELQMFLNKNPDLCL
jgi:hypothetical protein